jgi:hypothetical protein
MINATIAIPTTVTAIPECFLIVPIIAIFLYLFSVENSVQIYEDFFSFRKKTFGFYIQAVYFCKNQTVVVPKYFQRHRLQHEYDFLNKSLRYVLSGGR